jgi:hypothetical protein
LMLTGVNWQKNGRNDINVESMLIGNLI